MGFSLITDKGAAFSCLLWEMAFSLLYPFSLWAYSTSECQDTLQTAGLCCIYDSRQKEDKHAMVHSEGARCLGALPHWRTPLGLLPCLGFFLCNMRWQRPLSDNTCWRWWWCAQEVTEHLELRPLFSLAALVLFNYLTKALSVQPTLQYSLTNSCLHMKSEDLTLKGRRTGERWETNGESMP